MVLRTPPPSPVKATGNNPPSAGATASISTLSPGASAMQHSSSTPNLASTLGLQMDSVNAIPRGFKRKHDGLDNADEFRDFVGTMRGMFASFSNDIESRLNALQENITIIRNQNNDITKSVEFMSEKHDELIKRIDVLESEKRKDRQYINSLEDKIELLERKTRSSCVEVRNIPKITDETSHESKNHLCKVLKNLADLVRLPIGDSEIKDIYRTSNTKDSARPIIVEFSSVLKKEALISAIKTFNKNKPNADKLNTTHLGIAVPKKGIFVSETLTPKTQRLFYLAREFAKENNYDFCWTSRGIVYLRKSEKKPFNRIISENDLSNLKNKA